VWYLQMSPPRLFRCVGMSSRFSCCTSRCVGATLTRYLQDGFGHDVTGLLPV
jgi:hypothetical protein